MSTVYHQEPPTSGKVILKTNYGNNLIFLYLFFRRYWNRVMG